MNLDRSVTSINECFSECLETAREVESAGYWSGEDKIGLDVYRTLIKLIAYLMVADGYLQDSEVELYRLIHNKPEQSYEEVKEILLYQLDTFPYFLEEIPEYLEVVMDFDEDHNTSHTATIITSLERIGISTISCDDDMSLKEVRRLSSYTNFLKDVATARSLKVTLAEDGEIRDENLQHPQEIKTSDSVEHNINTLMASLNRLVGLNKVKTDVTSLTNLLKVRELRRQQNMPMPPISMHLVFTGNPGTGKTTVARLLAQIYKSMGMLSTGQLIETDRSGLIAAYLGQTALKVQAVVKEAIGGVLFIDEAYSLINPGYHSDQYGEEAIGTLLKLMEDNRDNLIVIVAGYPDKMEGFLEANPGLRSRFNKFIQFDDYTPDELHTIFVRMCQDNGYALSEKADGLAQFLWETEYKKGNTKNGNGRAVRNFFESTISNHANRLATKTSLNAQDLSTIMAQDLPNLLV